MKGKHLFIACCACLACLVIGMIAGTLIERRHLNFWFPVDERAEVRETIEKARRMMAELEEIRATIEEMNKEAEGSIVWNETLSKVRLSAED